MSPNHVEFNCDWVRADNEKRRAYLVAVFRAIANHLEDWTKPDIGLIFEETSEEKDAPKNS